MSIDLISELYPGVFSIQEDNVRMYLIRGNDRALLLDTGYEGGGPAARVRRLYDGPLLVANTHSHLDHAGGNREFEQVCAHPADWPAICEVSGMEPEKLLPLREGDRLDLGGRVLEVLETPGHTPGSVVLLDRANRLLFGGDNVSDRPIYLFLKGASIPDYAESLKRIIDLSGDYDVILGCHGEAGQSREMAEALLRCVRAFQEGTLEGLPLEDYNGMARMLYELDGASFYGPPR